MTTCGSQVWRHFPLRENSALHFLGDSQRRARSRVSGRTRTRALAATPCPPRRDAALPGQHLQTPGCARELTAISQTLIQMTYGPGIWSAWVWGVKGSEVFFSGGCSQTRKKPGARMGDGTCDTATPVSSAGHRSGWEIPGPPWSLQWVLAGRGTGPAALTLAPGDKQGPGQSTAGPDCAAHGLGLRPRRRVTGALHGDSQTRRYGKGATETFLLTFGLGWWLGSRRNTI